MNELVKWIVSLLSDLRPWEIVLPWQRAVRVRFGKWTRIWEPGFHFRLPIFDAVKPVNTRLRIACVPSQTITTKDGKTLTVAANLGFRISDPLRAMLRLQAPESTCAALVQAEFTRLITPCVLADIQASEIEAASLEALKAAYGDAIAFDFVHVVDFAAVKTLRLLNESWRPNTGHDGNDL